MTWSELPTTPTTRPQASRENRASGQSSIRLLEKIVTLHPDIVLALPAFNGAETITGLERLNLPVFLFNTTNMSDIYRNIARWGACLEETTRPRL